MIEEKDQETAGNYGQNIFFVRHENIVANVPLSEAEKAVYAEKMAALDKGIEELEAQRAAISKSMKEQIDAKKQELRELSASVNNGIRRNVFCDCLKDFNTEEMVWVKKNPPYTEILRRKMTDDEKQPTLLEYN